jgi:hypothetical protein
MPLPVVLIFSWRAELEAGLGALEELFEVAAAVDIDGREECASELRSSVGGSAVRLGWRSNVRKERWAVGGGRWGKSSGAWVRAAQGTQCDNGRRVEGNGSGKPYGGVRGGLGGCARQQPEVESEVHDAKLIAWMKQVRELNQPQ